MIFAVDFDGTLAITKWPTIISPIMPMITFSILARQGGNKVILNTCRTGKPLEDAVEFCKTFGLEFDAINENLPELIAQYNSDSRKISADYYIDDKNVHPSDMMNDLFICKDWWDKLKEASERKMETNETIQI
jgi:hypothetical protein